MKYLLVLLVILPFIMAAPEKRFLVDVKQVIQQIESFAHSGMAHDTCVSECQKLIGGLGSLLCGTGCTTVLNLIP